MTQTPATPPASGARALVGGLAVAAATMLVLELFIIMVLRMPDLFLLAAPATFLFVAVAGPPTAWAASRLSRGAGPRRAVLTHGAAAALAGAVWGYPVFALALQWAAQPDPAPRAPALAAIGAFYLATTAAAGALAGRYLAPWLVTRPSLVRTLVGAVAATTAICLGVLLLVRF
ncbi:hypothetical protein [Cellulomonas bogoriensis]|uniref:Uncharacterized protein n=1 Tax=Cellulomonas bogoriensis 69B4 = DSM 16987 TaxID=1386082 RepID=A0A0A0BNY6_9CELL|nr:hypothetical protein [Cellulomonas bogoriensis]KGM09660.1 hypothetical protein N869_06260 [Cellulomonas bogoriensis 69B4 = DSM 16987]